MGNLLTWKSGEMTHTGHLCDYNYGIKGKINYKKVVTTQQVGALWSL